MTLKNSYSRTTTNPIEKIQKILSENGADKLMFDYAKDGSGELLAITFAIDVDGKSMGFRLPALIENVVEIMYGGLDRYDRPKKITPTQRAQAYKTGWANIRDWIDAQLALVKTRQVKIQHVFLPYLIMKGGQTLSETIDRDPAFLLGSGK